MPAEPKLELKCFVVGKGGNKTCKQKAIDSAYHVELLKNHTHTRTHISCKSEELVITETVWDNESTLPEESQFNLLPFMECANHIN